MYNILIVDDEVIAVEGIKSALPWSRLGISEVYTAYNIRRAKEVFMSSQINIMLCDIEMPQGNGIELLAWVKENYPGTISIFLTCHADFDYARQAVKLGCLDYILKPIPFHELEEVVQKAMNEIKNRTELMKNSKHGEDWFKSQPVLIENFWADIMNQTIASVPELIKEAAVNRSIPYDETIKLLPILIIQQQWNIELTPVQKKLARIEFKEYVREMVIRSEGKGEIIKLAHRRYLAILYRDVLEDYSIDMISANCRSFIKRCCEQMNCNISCYIGEGAESHELLETVEKLAVMEENYAAIHNRVYLISKAEQTALKIKMPDMSIWSVMLMDGSPNKVIEEAGIFLTGLQKVAELDKSTMHHFQQDFLQMIYTFLKQKGMHAHQLLSDRMDVELHEKACRSVANLLNWIRHVTMKSMEYVKTIEESQSVVEKSKKYISLHIDKDISRDDVANHVFLNSDYLTRLFKKETGMSIAEYIVMERIKLAKELLIKTEMPVSAVAARVGYTNFSHFAKMFRKHTNMNPQDYRQKKYNFSNKSE